MTDYFREMFEALKQTAEGTVQAMEGVKKMAEAALHARDEHEDLRETVGRLEHLVMAQGQELRAMRERLDRGDA